MGLQGNLVVKIVLRGVYAISALMFFQSAVNICQLCSTQVAVVLMLAHLYVNWPLPVL